MFARWLQVHCWNSDDFFYTSMLAEEGRPFLDLDQGLAFLCNGPALVPAVKKERLKE
jgi:hypothetical protein